MSYPDVTLYSLTTCAYCNAIKKMLATLDIPHQFIDADLLEGAERQEVLAQLGAINPQCSFPTTRIGEKTVIGFKVQEIKEAIGVRTEVDDLHDLLKKINEPKGYFFNRDNERTFDLLRGLMTNKDRYGYMACPCRLASGDRRSDEDIICPCIYREPDVKEFGSCFCALYVSADWNSGRITPKEVPERRPASDAHSGSSED